jgi:hypothetical protein
MSNLVELKPFRSITDIYNELPLDIRTICSEVSIEYQIRDLHIERDREIRSHKKHIAEIDSHLANCQRDLIKMQNDRRTP